MRLSLNVLYLIGCLLKRSSVVNGRFFLVPVSFSFTALLRGAWARSCCWTGYSADKAIYFYYRCFYSAQIIILFSQSLSDARGPFHVFTLHGFWFIVHVSASPDINYFLVSLSLLRSRELYVDPLSTTNKFVVLVLNMHMWLPLHNVLHVAYRCGSHFVTVLFLSCTTRIFVALHFVTK